MLEPVGSTGSSRAGSPSTGIPRLTIGVGLVCATVIFVGGQSIVWAFSKLPIAVPNAVLIAHRSSHDVRYGAGLWRRSTESTSRPALARMDPFVASSPSNIITKHAGSIRGLPPSSQARYSSMQFECDGRSNSIPYARINDDYCDCTDGSDEPGTSACANGIFYCGWADGTSASQSVFATLNASSVNDGVCDCCNGADEWLHHATCDNTCAKAIEAEKRAEGRMREARLKRLEYVREAEAMVANLEPITQDFGPQNVFLPLSKRCFETDKQGYHFEICPFRTITQIDRGHRTLAGNGQKSRWLVQASSGFAELEMCCGEFCGAVHTARTSRIIFKCGAKDEILSVSETETCMYVVTMQTPAACKP